MARLSWPGGWINTKLYTVSQEKCCHFVLITLVWQFLSYFYAFCTNVNRNEYSTAYLLDALMIS